MPENRIEEVVRSAVAQALEHQLAGLRESIIQEVLQQVSKSQPSGNSGGTAALQKAVSAIQAGSTQKEILRALLDNTVVYSGRSALLVVKNGAATGWQGTGFSNNDSIKDFGFNIQSPLAARVMQSREAQAGSVADVDANFVATFGAPADDKTLILPLLLKDKISALVYADAGAETAALDSAALDVLVRATSAWLEVISQRKQAHKEGTAEPEMHASAPAANDPFAAHAPIHSAAVAIAEPAPEAAMSAAAAWGGAPSAPAPNPEDAEIHRKAQRFARLLMDEIKLYNQAKLIEGRRNKNVYDLLKEDIEKSRATYQKRYGNTPAGTADYFTQELIRSLAEDDVSLLGSNFRR